MISGVQQAASALSNLSLFVTGINFGYMPINALTGAKMAPAFFFQIEGENKIHLSGETTDNYLEDNTSVQDHFIARPETFTVRAKIGEVDIIQPTLLPTSVPIQAVLGLVSAFSPSFSQAATNVINQTNQAYTEAQNAANGAVAAYSSLTGTAGPNIITGQGEVEKSPSQTKQQAMFSQIYGYWRQQANPLKPVLFVVQTPWALWTPAVLLECETTQSEETDMESEFYLTFKMIRIVNEANLGVQAIGRAANLAAPNTNNGTVSPLAAPNVTSFLQSAFQGGF